MEQRRRQVEKAARRHRPWRLNLKKLEGQQKAVEKQATGQAKAINTSELALTNAESSSQGHRICLENCQCGAGQIIHTVGARFGAATEGAQKRGLVQCRAENEPQPGRKNDMGLTRCPLWRREQPALKTAIGLGKRRLQACKNS